ncbi:MAG: cytochrome P450 [Monoraphidium minutum]|nr:MAG: cytochrome P450 [Monoraphidium minutum]
MQLRQNAAQGARERPAAAGPRGAPGPARRPRVISARAASSETAQRDAAFTGSDGDARCPFLAALPPPPSVKLPFWRRIDQLRDARRFQDDAFASAGGASVVEIPSALGMPPQVMPGTADMVKAVLTKEGELAKTTKIMAAGDLIGEEGILFAPPEEHRHLRGLLTPPLTNEAVHRLAPVVVDIVARTFDGWAAAGGPVKAYDGIKRLTFEVMMAIMLGKNKEPAEMDRMHRLYADFSGGFGAWPFLDLPFTRYGRAMNARRTLLQYFTDEVVADRARVDRGEDVAGLHGALLKAVDLRGERLTDDFLAANLLGLLFAGHDTTSTTITNLVFSLHQHPQVVARLRAEQAELVAQHGPGITAKHLRGMKYGEAVVREQMRYQPIASGGVREAINDFEMGGYKVTKGTTLYLPLARISALDPRWADEAGELAPGAFNPDRWLMPTAGAGPANDHQMPFGFGPRYCLGAPLAFVESKAFLALLAQSYSFTLTEPDTTEWTQQVGLIPTNGLPMVVKPLAAA